MMHPALQALTIAGGFVAVGVGAAAWDFALYTRTKAREAREFAHRRHVQSNHLVPDERGDPLDCWDSEHNHDPRDFDGRFRTRTDSMVRVVVVFGGAVGAVIALLIAGVLGLSALVIG